MKNRDTLLRLADFQTQCHSDEQNSSKNSVWLWQHFPLLSVVVFMSLTVGCTSNIAFRAEETVCRESQCDKRSAMIEQHQDKDNKPKFDLAFVEFTERGNVFDRESMEKVLAHVHRFATTDTGNHLPYPTGKDGAPGVLVVVFVHGWRHNADVEDRNVQSFRGLLEKASNSEVRHQILGNRRLIGIYVGWRGLVVNPDSPLSLPSYWDRKTVAHEVGKGGVSELLLRLQHSVLGGDDLREDRESKNLFLVTGHSFGGAIVLSALNEILLERIISARPIEGRCDQQVSLNCTCLQTRPFTHGVVLLNPAIEANDILQLKELVAQRCFAPAQNKLLHVISSDADAATHRFFPIGQWLAMLSWQEAQFPRRFGNTEITFEESELDRTTIGNFVPFRTGKFTKNGTEWKYENCENGKDECLSEFGGDLTEKRRHIPVSDHEPLAFISTDGHFIEDHNDVFNENVAAYLAAIVDQTRTKQHPTNGDVPRQCKNGDKFDFDGCFKHFHGIFRNGSHASRPDF